MKSKIIFFKILLVFIFVVDLNAQDTSYNVSNLVPRYNSTNYLIPYAVNVPSKVGVDYLKSTCFLINTTITKQTLQSIENTKTGTPICQVSLYSSTTYTYVTTLQFLIEYESPGIYKIIINKLDYRSSDLSIKGKTFKYKEADILFDKNTNNTSLNIFVSDYNMLICTDSQDIAQNNNNIVFSQSPVFYGFDSSPNTITDTSSFITGKGGLLPFIQNFNDRALNIYYAKDDISTIIKSLSGKVTNSRVAAPAESEIPETVATDLGNSLKIYPNPSNNGAFSLDFTMKEAGSANFEIIDIKGQKVFEQKDQNLPQGDNTKVIDTQNQLPAGTYIVRITGSDSLMSTGRILIK